MNTFQKVKSWLKTPVFTRYNGNGVLSRLFAGMATADSYDHEARAGKAWENSSVAACVKAMLRMITDAEIGTQRRKPTTKGGGWQWDHDHDLTTLLQNPNDHFDATQMLDAIVISYVFAGEAFLWKERAPSRKVRGLWFIPADMIEPKRPEDGSAYLSHYEYLVNGKTYGIPVEDIIHIKNGVDPENELRGWSDVKASCRARATENEAANFVNAVLHNCGVPFVVVTPDTTASPNSSIENPADFGQRWMQKFGGKRRGEPFINSHGLKVQVLGFDPKSLDLSTLKKLAQADIAALIGIPAVVVGLYVGLETATAKASHESSLWQAYVSCILPMLKRIARQLSKGLVNDKFAPYGDSKKVRVWFDLSDVKCLGEDLDKKAKRIIDLFNAGLIKRGQGQSELDYPVDEAANDYKSASAAPQAEADPKDANKKPDDGSDEDDETEED